MGGRGTFASGNNVAYTYETVGKIAGVKIIRPIDRTKSLKLPEESHSSMGSEEKLLTFVLHSRMMVARKEGMDITKRDVG